jgi:ATP-binding cassette subfamily C protein
MENLRENRILFTLKMFWRAFGSYRYQILFLISISFLGSLFESIGINSIIPLFSFVVKNQNQATDLVSKYTQVFFDFMHIPYELKYLLVMIAILFTAKSIMTFFTNYITDRIRTDYVKKTRNKLFNLTLHSNWTYLSKQKIGYLEKVLMVDINTYSALLSYTSSSIILIINAGIYSLVAFSISPSVTLITIATGGIFFLVSKPLVYRVRVVSHQSANLLKKIANQINESMLGMKTVKAMNLENSVVSRLQTNFEDLKNIEMRVSVLSSITYVITQPLSVLLIIGLFAFSYKLTDFNFASFAVIVYAINKIFTYVQDGQARIQNINALFPFLKTAYEYENQAIENQERFSGLNKIDFTKDIIFKNVSFKYSAEHHTLSDINLKIEPGTITGIIGPSGAGKTTLVDLLLGLINTSEGEIMIGDHDVKTISRDSWRNKIGYVSQDIFLINDTIENNIKLYNPQISNEDMINASKIANIYDFVIKQPHGFQTPVGERGMEVSGGQRQRIALARVLARNPKLIILDEATSALDNESEKMVQRAIEELRGKITVVIIAHRPSTVINSDKIIVLKSGKIVESGSPAELKENPESYFSKIL